MNTFFLPAAVPHFVRGGEIYGLIVSSKSQQYILHGDRTGEMNRSLVMTRFSSAVAFIAAD